jgi:hypothetical protein
MDTAVSLVGEARGIKRPDKKRKREKKKNHVNNPLSWLPAGDKKGCDQGDGYVHKI